MWRLLNILRDMYSNVTLILTAVIVIVLTQVNPKAKPVEETAKPPGNLMACIFWQGHHDIDIWGGSPDDDKGVGYSRKNGKSLDLVRDDLGTDNVPHFECEFAHQTPDGRWAFNAHGYSVTEPSVNVRAEVRLGGPDGFKLLFSASLDIKQGQERTIAQFRLQNDELVPGSLNSVLVPLRSAK